MLEVARLELADLLGVAALRERREPDEVGEQDADEAALGDGVGGGRGAAGAGDGGRGRGAVARAAAPASGVAHSEQNLAAGRFVAPQFGQVSPNGVAHSMQNRAPGRFSVPQLEQITPVPPPAPPSSGAEDSRPHLR